MVGAGERTPRQTWRRLSTFAGALSARLGERLPALAAARHGVGIRLLAGVLLFSMFVTVILTGIQLYRDYQRDVAGITSRLDQIGKSHLVSLAESLWILDQTQLQLQLDGIVQQPDIRAAEVRELYSPVSPLVLKVGESPVSGLVARDYPLAQVVQGESRVIGTLRVEATLADAYRRLVETAGRVFATRAAEIFLVALFIIFFFNNLVTRHLSAIAAEVGSYRIGDSPLHLHLKRSPRRHDDELQRVTAAFNSLSFNLHTAYRDLAEREARIRRLVDANIIGVFFWDFEGGIIEANDAFLGIVGYSREDLTPGRIRWTDLTPPEWTPRDRQLVSQIRRTGFVQAYEKEFFRKDGSRVPVLIGAATIEPGGDQGVAFVLDLTERKRAEAEARKSEERYREVQNALAHANRVATMGQLTASIAHEVKQPITSTVLNAQVALLQLTSPPLDMAELRESLEQIVKDGNRASDVISRIRALVQKAPLKKDRLEINDVIREVIGLTRAEAMRNRVSVRTELADDLPPVQGDRVQLQQVILNLIVNAMEAMSSDSEGPRELVIGTARADPEGVLVTVRDTGPGFPPGALDRLFEAFHTTKPTGLGMGLSISRSIVEAHGGRLWASANQPRGAIFQFTVPADHDPAA
ncbi:MAG: domain S-box protein [Devosia sp.]|uniref:sensor histidine kinase n=1 Tax=Devosia sp. TaxID=1871048 RepID=UPI0026057A98|nr:ATP-binding protein [Devosia sp.]MDB5541276.1 domain S-box protein [Devosia sp.]